MIANDFTFSFAAQPYQIQQDQIQPGMRRQHLRVELRLNGELQVRYQGRYCPSLRAPNAPWNSPSLGRLPSAKITTRLSRPSAPETDLGYQNIQSLR